MNSSGVGLRENCGLRNAENQHLVKCGTFSEERFAFYPLFIFRIPHFTLIVLRRLLSVHFRIVLHILLRSPLSIRLRRLLRIILRIPLYTCTPS